MGQAAKKIAEARKKLTQALKRENIFDDLTARLRSCPPNAVLARFARWTAEGGPSLRGRVTLDPL